MDPLDLPEPTPHIVGSAKPRTPELILTPVRISTPKPVAVPMPPQEKNTMQFPAWRVLRPVVLMLGAVLASTGFLPSDATQALVEHGEIAVSAVLGLWSATAFLRNHKDSKATA